MPRERWFYAKEMRRMGPLPNKRLLVEALLSLPDPRGALIWRHGLTAWTPARDVPEIERQLAPFVKSEPPAAAPVAVRAEPVEAPPVRVPARAQTPNVALYFGGVGAVLAIVVVAWIAWPRSGSVGGGAPPPPTVTGAPPAGTSSAGGAAGGAAPAATGTAAGGSARFAGWSGQEAELPAAELRKLRGVGAWSGDRLTVTVYNGSTWRVTEILVRTSVLRGEEFVDAGEPHWLKPAGGAPTDPGTAELLDKVAPDRRKSGVNPLDTGPFEGNVGPKPEAYRWRIEAARGYPPLT